jgi:hypothetical protein
LITGAYGRLCCRMPGEHSPDMGFSLEGAPMRVSGDGLEWDGDLSQN